MAADQAAALDAIWGGLHQRVSGVHGVVLGRKVARWSLARFLGA